MIRALLYLRLTSLRNGLVSRLKRLRQPKYFFGAIAGFAYFYFIFFRQIGGAPTGRTAQKLAASPLPAALAKEDE
eukprot:gene55190-75625_t